MKLAVKIACVVLLLFNGIGAVYGGLSLMTSPNGSSIGLSLNWLKHSPFHNYLVPGIVLFVCNGLFSFFVFYKLIRNTRSYPLLVMAQGVILTGWIIIEMCFMRTTHLLHIILGATGVLLFMGGYVLQRMTNTNKNGIK